ncbi:MAG: rhodanese-like domain-containing protein, partial [Xanthomonadales bacterium]|nr:rhodanese-like domain-containing protein [Xanthomonadales bacterium]
LTNLINRDNALLVDLSNHSEFDKGHIPGARHVDLAQFDPEHKDLAKAKTLPVVVCCKSGTQSAKAAQRLSKAGFSQVYTLGGGVDAWRSARLPLAKGRN